MENKSYTSLILTGDLRGFQYIRRSFTELPENTFNFCCTVEGGIARRDSEVDIYNKKPIVQDAALRAFREQELEQERTRLADERHLLSIEKARLSEVRR